jgi:ABC-type multidrug transport system fused ATPase/permease subunit
VATEEAIVSNSQLWKDSLGYVPQDIFLLDGTISSNIAFGVQDSEVDFDRVVRCAEVAMLTEFINFELEEKFDTKVGERGVKLSGGQKQRIGIARALYRSPQVLVLDEATSALDTITEAKVIEGIFNENKGITIVMVAHRLSTIKNCDLLVFLEQGSIHGPASYSELQQSCEGFSDLLSQN